MSLWFLCFCGKISYSRGKDSIGEFLIWSIELNPNSGSETMAFINTIPEDQAPTDVKQMYEENIAEMGYLPNYVRVFSHRPKFWKRGVIY